MKVAKLRRRQSSRSEMSMFALDAYMIVFGDRYDTTLVFVATSAPSHTQDRTQAAGGAVGVIAKRGHGTFSKGLKEMRLFVHIKSTYMAMYILSH